MTSFAQFSENFDASTTLPAGWSVINGGDANTWTVSTPGNGTANSGTNVVRIYYNATTAHDDYLVTPQFTVTAGVSDYLNLYARNRSTTFPEPFDILLSTTGTATTDFTTTIAAAVSPGITWGSYGYDLTAYAGQTVYIAFRSTTLDQWQLYLDDISVGALPNPIDYANLQWPPTGSIVQGGSLTVYGQVYEAGLTDTTSGQAPGIQAWVGTNATNTNPNTWTNWTAATFNVEAGNNDEYQAAIGSGLTPGTYYYATRFKLGNGSYVYGGINASAPNNGNFWDGATFGSGVLTVTPPPPPANDDCTGAIGLTVNPDYACGAVTPGTVLGATASTVDATACAGTEDDDVWFSFVATATTHRISLLNIAGSTVDMYHSLWTGTDCSSLSLVTGSCSDADTSNPTGLVIGQTYYVRVNTYTATGGQTSTFNVCIGTPPPPPANDDCAGAIVVACGSATLGSTASSTNENAAVCGINVVTVQNTPGVWYKYIGDGSNVTVTTCSPTITTGDSRIAIFSGSCGALTCVAGNDDAELVGCSTNALSSLVTFNTVVGTDYYILVYAYTSTALSFELNVSCTAPCSPATTNDDCATALPVTVGTTVTGADNLCSSASLGVTYPSCGNQFGTYYDTWYSFDTGNGTDFTITLANPSGTTGFALYSGTCGALTMVTGSCTTTAGSVSLTGLTAGATYYLRVFSATPAARGTFDLTISDNGLGTNTFDNSNFSYYPNPVKNILTLSYNQQISSVEVFNLLGQKVSYNKFNANQAQVDMSNLSDGAYMVKVTSNGQVKTIKVIKQ